MPATCARSASSRRTVPPSSIPDSGPVAVHAAIPSDRTCSAFGTVWRSTQYRAQRISAAAPTNSTMRRAVLPARFPAPAA
jgi:hypothetical protein